MSFGIIVKTDKIHMELSVLTISYFENFSSLQMLHKEHSRRNFVPCLPIRNHSGNEMRRFQEKRTSELFFQFGVLLFIFLYDLVAALLAPFLNLSHIACFVDIAHHKLNMSVRNELIKLSATF